MAQTTGGYIPFPPKKHGMSFELPIGPTMTTSQFNAHIDLMGFPSSKRLVDTGG